jgi:uroporphyrinogen decarboxylase
MAESVYRELLLPYDVNVLRQLPTEAWFNVVHLCGSNLNFGLTREMPAQAISWSVHNQGNPSLAQGRETSGRPVMGGLGQRASLLYGPPAEVEAEARNAVEETGGRGLLLAPGCSVPTRAKDANLAAMVTAIAA